MVGFRKILGISILTISLWIASCIPPSRSLYRAIDSFREKFRAEATLENYNSGNKLDEIRRERDDFLKQNYAKMFPNLTNILDPVGWVVAPYGKPNKARGVGVRGLDTWVFCYNPIPYYIDQSKQL